MTVAKREAILFLFGCSEVNSTWLITSELANQCMRKALLTCVVYTIHIRSEFSIKIRARPFVKIDHMIFIYVTTPHSESAVLPITHEIVRYCKWLRGLHRLEKRKSFKSSVTCVQGICEFVICLLLKYACTYLRIFYLLKLSCHNNCYRFMFSLKRVSRVVNSDRILKGLETVSSCFVYKYTHLLTVQ